MIPTSGPNDKESNNLFPYRRDPNPVLIQQTLILRANILPPLLISIFSGRWQGVNLRSALLTNCGGCYCGGQVLVLESLALFCFNGLETASQIPTRALGADNSWVGSHVGAAFAARRGTVAVRVGDALGAVTAGVN